MNGFNIIMVIAVILFARLGVRLVSRYLKMKKEEDSKKDWKPDFLYLIWTGNMWKLKKALSSLVNQKLLSVPQESSGAARRDKLAR